MVKTRFGSRGGEGLRGAVRKQSWLLLRQFLVLLLLLLMRFFLS